MKESPDKLLLLEKCIDIGYVSNKQYISKIEDNKFDYLQVNSYQEQDNQILEDIKNKLKLIFPVAENVEELNRIKQYSDRNENIDCEFRVYNVGQAQAVSLAVNNEPPFLYFDYGMLYGSNSFTHKTV